MTLNRTLDAVLLAMLPPALARDLAPEAADDPAWVRDMAYQYLFADETSKADMLAFHESGGVGMVAKAAEKAARAEDSFTAGSAPPEAPVP